MMKVLASILIFAAIICAVYYGSGQSLGVREAKEASMLKFLHLSLLDYELTHDQLPSSIEAGIEQGLLERFPKDRVEYLEDVMGDGRLQYSRREKGGFSIRMTTCRDRELTVDGFRE